MTNNFIFKDIIMVNIMKCTHCNLNFDNKEDLFKHFRTPEHDDNIKEDESDDEDCSKRYR